MNKKYFKKKLFEKIDKCIGNDIEMLSKEDIDNLVNDTKTRFETLPKDIIGEIVNACNSQIVWYVEKNVLYDDSDIYGHFSSQKEALRVAKLIAEYYNFNKNIQFDEKSLTYSYRDVTVSVKEEKICHKAEDFDFFNHLMKNEK